MTQSRSRTARGNSAPRGATAKPAAPSKSTKSTKARKMSDFEIDPEVLDEKYNQVRRPTLPYAFVLNADPCGIFVPEDQFEEIGFIALPDEEDLTTAAPSGNKVRGLLLDSVRMAILAYTPEYIRYKRDEDLGELSNTIVGLYDDHRSLHEQNRQTMDVCSDHAIVLLDENNEPVHSTPISIRFKNVALWSFKSVRDKTYPLFERAFAKRAGVPYSGKSDRWRSMCVLEVRFVPELQGKKKSKSSYCCKTESITKPTVDTLPELLLATRETKEMIWGFYDAAAGYADLPQLAAASSNSSRTTIAKASPNGGKSTKRADTSTDFDFDDEDAIDVEAEALLDDEEDVEETELIDEDELDEVVDEGEEFDDDFDEEEEEEED